jgi:hypothetical protein
MRTYLQCSQPIDRLTDDDHIHVLQVSKAGNRYGHQFFCNGECMMAYYRGLHTVRWKRIRNLHTIYKAKEMKLGAVMDQLFGYEETKNR